MSISLDSDIWVPNLSVREIRQHLALRGIVLRGKRRRVEYAQILDGLLRKETRGGLPGQPRVVLKAQLPHLPSSLICHMLLFLPFPQMPHVAQTCQALRTVCSLSLQRRPTPVFAFLRAVDLRSLPRRSSVVIRQAVEHFPQLHTLKLGSITPALLDRIVRCHATRLRSLQLTFLKQSQPLHRILLGPLVHCTQLQELIIAFRRSGFRVIHPLLLGEGAT